MVLPESWKRSCLNFYAHDCTYLQKYFLDKTFKAWIADGHYYITIEKTNSNPKIPWVSKIYHVIQEPRFTFQWRKCGPKTSDNDKKRWAYEATRSCMQPKNKIDSTYHSSSSSIISSIFRAPLMIEKIHKIPIPKKSFKNVKNLN